MAQKRADTASEPVTAYEISKKNGLLLIQWQANGTLHRSWIKPDMVSQREGKKLLVQRPEAGVPYGINWATLVGDLRISKVELDRELKQREIWTSEDLRTHPNEVLSAIHAACGIAFASLLAGAKAYEKDLYG